MSYDRIDFFYGRVFPELKLFAGRRERRDALNIASRNVRRWAYGLSVPWCVGVVFAGRWMAGVFNSINELLILFPAGLLIGIGIGYVPLLVCSARIRHSLRKQLNAIGTRVCLRCGYRLRGLTIDRCPECGIVFARGGLGDATDTHCISA